VLPSAQPDCPGLPQAGCTAQFQVGSIALREISCDQDDGCQHLLSTLTHVHAGTPMHRHHVMV
jgi:hypothetical protein